MVSVKPRRPVVWVPDTTVDNCKRCKELFGYLNRKHHCRACGHIFCSSCSPHFSSLPSFLPKTLAEYGQGEARLCITCFEEIQKTKISRKLVIIFSFLPIQLQEFIALLCVSKKWKEAASRILAMFKGIQYKMGFEKFTKMERRLLKTHWKSFYGHSRLMVQTIRCLGGSCTQLSDVVRFYKEERGKNTSCAALFCDECICHEKLEIHDLLELLYCATNKTILQNEEVEVWLGNALTQMNLSWLMIFMPWLLTIGFTPACQRLIHNYLLPLVLNCKNFAFKFYFEAKLCRTENSRHEDFYVALMERVLQLVNQDLRDDIAKVETLTHVLQFPEKVTQQQLDDMGNICMPYNPHIIIKKILLSQRKQLNSYTKPWVLPMHTSEGLKHILIKRDDLRKDRLVVIVSYYLQSKIRNFNLQPYNVFPVSNSCGWIEMLQETKTLYDIEADKISLQNYILNNNAHDNILSIRRRFIQTCGSNCVLSYILGLGDRNTHNILITSTGNLVNIDFSYLLGTDPKFETNCEMKITKSMLDMLGGKSSDGFAAFQQFTKDGYKHVRKLAPFWYTLYTYLAVCEPPIYPHANDLKAIKKFCEERLMISYSDEEMEVAIVEIVNKNSSGSWRQQLSDYSHSFRTSITDLIFKMDV